MTNLAIFKPQNFTENIRAEISFYIWTQEVDIFDGLLKIFVENYYFDRRKLTE